MYFIYYNEKKKNFINGLCSRYCLYIRFICRLVNYVCMDCLFVKLKYFLLFLYSNYLVIFF